MKPLVIFSDFDGTLTTDGFMSPIFFDILSLCKKNNSEFIIVSGRSLSWGHFFLTHFPINYAVMEGGGVVLVKDDLYRISHDVLVDSEELAELEDISATLIEDHEDCELSADSFGRLTDRAVELKDIKASNLDAIKEFLSNHSVNFSCSNVHLNFWVGDISKAKACSFVLDKYFEGAGRDECVFYGDAPNDSSMFEQFPNSVGVSNIKEYLDQLNHKPKIILQGDENMGERGVLNHLQSLFSK